MQVHVTLLLFYAILIHKPLIYIPKIVGKMALMTENAKK